MGRYKCAYNCESANESDEKFFKFPLYHSRKLKKWLANMKLKDWTPSRFSVLCINHFEEKCLDRTGKCVKLRDDAVPTIFLSPANTQKGKASTKPRSKRNRPQRKGTHKAQSPVTSPATTKQSEDSKESTSLTEQESAGDTSLLTFGKWRIIADEGLMMIESFPNFFHGDYCASRDILWAPDDNVIIENKDPENVIEVTEPWQWLGLDVRGPLPKTLNGHQYILTMTDYYSKWVEAVPMQLCLPPNVAKHIVEVIAHFGYPVRILSRLPHDVVQKINGLLKNELNLTIALVVYHQQTGTADLITQHLINRMVSDLIEEHVADWDVHLPAKVFSLCCKEHSKTKERPFSTLCCTGLEPVQTPRGLDYVYSKIQESAFVVR
ncbi:hypothetical protein JOB18_047896 [Solea senegalensis]|uniref:THAP-type domain-containing protein n=1 Tax=Solea senegalensis TaxID=28829 RepID=A0AAV6R0N7_SOLSE|nr:uncharacterized protein zgc:153292 [Solea senegalensis]KAG7498045.1 hypothetical protein JOB18_047896 [Solea senegalensis]